MGSNQKPSKFRVQEDFLTTSKLSEVCVEYAGIQTGPFGSQLHQRDYVKIGTPIITVEHLGENRILHNNLPCVTESDRIRLSKYSLREGDIVFSRVGSVDRRALVRKDEEGWLFSGRCLRVRPNPEKIDSEFLSFFLGLASFKEYIKGIAVGATMPSINTQILSNIDIHYPSNLAEQHAIAHILGTLDDKIELNRRMNDTLEGMARALFKSWFIDFDPVRAKAEGRDTGLPQEIDDLFPDEFVDSELGEIPKGWEISNVKQQFYLSMGQSPPGESYNTSGQGLPFYQGRSDFGFRFPRRRVYCTSPTRFAKKGDTLVSVRAPVGDINIAVEDCAIGRGVASIRHKSGSTPFTYHSMFFLKSHFEKYDKEGTIFGSINKSTFENIPIIVPENTILNIFEQIASPIENKIHFIEREVLCLSSLRDTLLPKLISGEIRVEDAEKFLEVRKA